MSQNQNKILRKISVVVGVVILVGGIYLANKLGTREKPVDAQATEKAAPQREATFVYARQVNNESRSSEVLLTGKVVARQKIDLFSEVTGKIEQSGKEFREGVRFSKGQLMLRLDDTEAQLEIQAAKSQLYSSLVALLPDLKTDYNDNFSVWESYLNNFDVEQPIQELPNTKSNREKYYVAARNINNQYLNIKRQEYRLTKYKIYAPFDGILTNAAVYKGALVRSGQKLGELTHPSRYELEATVSLYDVDFLKRGNKVRLYSEATKDEWTGTVDRFGKVIDEKTQTQKVYITLNSSKLSEGMFLNGTVQTKSLGEVMVLPRTLLVNNNKVFTIERGKLALAPVEVVKLDGNDMYIQGLQAGTTVLAQNLLGAYEGMPVQIIE
jgi:multidrug efflux pump subunit AcrA (membrane-fusion protein)